MCHESANTFGVIAGNDESVNIDELHACNHIFEILGLDTKWKANEGRMLFCEDTIESS